MTTSDHTRPGFRFEHPQLGGCLVTARRGDSVKYRAGLPPGNSTLYRTDAATLSRVLPVWNAALIEQNGQSGNGQSR